jgi:hypothetical protein
LIATKRQAKLYNAEFKCFIFHETANESELGTRQSFPGRQKNAK